MFNRLKLKLIPTLPLRSKLFLLRIGIGLFMGMLIGTISFYIAAALVQKNIQADLQLDARFATREINRAIQDLGHKLQFIAESEEVAKYFHTRRMALLSQLFQRYAGDFEKITYFDAQENVAASLLGGKFIEEKIALPPSPNYQSALNRPNTLIVGGLNDDEDLQTSILQYAYQHVDFFDNPMGVIQTSISLQKLAQRLESIFEKETRQFLLIVDTRNRIIYSPKTKDIGRSGTKILPKAFLDSSKSHECAYIGKHTVYEASCLVAVQPLTDLKWNVFVTRSTDSINKPLFTLGIWIFLATICVLFCGEVFSRLLGVKIIEPVNRFRQTVADIIDSGDMQKRVDWISDDEMGKLADAFNSMLAKISDAQIRLKDEQQFNENILNSMMDLMIVISAEGKIIKVNPITSSLSGYPEDELVSCPLNVLLGNVEQLMSEENKQHVAGGNVISIPEATLEVREGNSIPVSLRIASFMDHDGMLIGYLLTGKDIREELKYADEKQLAAEKLKAAQEDLLKTEKLAIVGQMSALVAHEVLNPISAIYARLEIKIKEEKEMTKVQELLQNVVDEWQRKFEVGEFESYLRANGHNDLQLLGKIADVLHERDSDRVENLNFILKLIRRVIRIIDNLREMSRREKTIEKIDLTKLIDEVVEDMGDGLSKRQIEVEKQYETYPELMADHMEIYSIFSNLLKNGMQAIDTRRNTDIKKITIKVWKDGSFAAVRITDTGTGIDAENRNKIFDTGFSSKGREGTGLGLSYSRKLARQIGGDLFLVESIPGRGSSFQVYFNPHRSEYGKQMAQ